MLTTCLPPDPLSPLPFHLPPPLLLQGGEIIGATLSGAGLRGIPGLTVFALDRTELGNVTRHEPVKHNEIIQEGDILWIAADLSGVTFVSKYPGLDIVQQGQIDRHGVHKLYQALHTAVV